MITKTSSDKEGKRILRHVRQGVRATFAVGVLVVVPPAAISEMYPPVEHDGTVSTMSRHTNTPADQRFQRIPYGAPTLTSRISKQELDQAIIWYSKQHRLPPAILRAVIKAESGFDPAAVSRAGAQGLMQLMPRTAAWLKVHDPFDPIANISGGAKH